MVVQPAEDSTIHEPVPTRSDHRGDEARRETLMDVEILATTELGDRSYIAHDPRVPGSAIVVDPQRDIDRVERVLLERGLGCALVLETHIHNDYVTGGFQLARRHGV